MTMTTEHDLLDTIAEGYRARGYVVEREASLLFEDGSTCRVDLIARKEAETRIVEVTSPGRRPAGVVPERISEWLRRHPDWHVDLVLAGSQDIAVSVAPRGSIEGRLTRASALVQSGDVDAALLLAWAAFEGAARHGLITDGAPLPRSPGPLPLIQSIAHRGLVEPDDVDRIRQVLVKRNLVAHGDVVAIDASEITLLIATARALLLGALPEAATSAA